MTATLSTADHHQAQSAIQFFKHKQTTHLTAVPNKSLSECYGKHAAIVERLYAIATDKAITCEGCRRIAQRKALKACSECSRLDRKDNYVKE